MHLHHFESEEDQGKPYDMEQPNFFGLSIAYDPYQRELVEGKNIDHLRRRRRLQYLRWHGSFAWIFTLFPSL